MSASLKNPSTEPGSITDYDVSLYLCGSRDTAHVVFIAYRSQYTSLMVGTYGITNSTDLLYLYQDWTLVSLVAENGNLSVYRGGLLVKKISYKGTHIGRLKSIGIGFKGPGSLDWVKMYSNQKAGNTTGKINNLIMKEEFNKNKSDIIWYL